MYVFQLNQPGRLPDTGVPMLQNGSKVNDFVFDPFDDSRLLVGRSSLNRQDLFSMVMLHSNDLLSHRSIVISSPSLRNIILSPTQLIVMW